jgi:hypothetical protein
VGSVQSVLVVHVLPKPVAPPSLLEPLELPELLPLLEPLELPELLPLLEPLELPELLPLELPLLEPLELPELLPLELPLELPDPELLLLLWLPASPLPELLSSDEHAGTAAKTRHEHASATSTLDLMRSSVKASPTSGDTVSRAGALFSLVSFAGALGVTNR